MYLADHRSIRPWLHKAVQEPSLVAQTPLQREIETGYSVTRPHVDICRVHQRIGVRFLVVQTGHRYVEQRFLRCLASWHEGYSFVLVTSCGSKEGLCCTSMRECRLIWWRLRVISALSRMNNFSDYASSPVTFPRVEWHFVDMADASCSCAATVRLPGNYLIYGPQYRVML